MESLKIVPIVCALVTPGILVLFLLVCSRQGIKPTILLTNYGDYFETEANSIWQHSRLLDLLFFLPVRREADEKGKRGACNLSKTVTYVTLEII